MPNPDRVSALLKDAVPTPPREISADAVAVIAQRRRRRIGVIAPAAAALLMAGVAAIAITLPGGGNSHQAAAPATEVHSTAPRPVTTGPSTGPLQHTPRGCPPSRAYRPGHGAAIDYVNFVQLHGFTYIEDYGHRGGHVRLGPAVARVTCTIANLPTTRYYVSYHYRDGNAAFLPVGTELRSVAGYPSDCRLAARWNGHLVQYLALRNGTQHAEFRSCALHAGRQ